ncbi:hypothetical protein BD309DRAFT_876479 [Dichomitus squalens]|nr:hypothetical protein BD309DRAFT_876479 [Dichomitus squalens]
MSISERTHIRWLPDEASEPTSTLVLTAHNRQFVDLRLVKPADPLAPFTCLDWGIGGRSVGILSHGEWIHDIDSRTENPDEKDEGDMHPHPELPNVILERGKMRHLESGEIREYEEGWKDLVILPVGGPETGRRTSVVLETAFDASDKSAVAGTRRGLIVRVGQFCQAILRDGPSIVVERWLWTADEGWKMLARIGEGAHLPCDLTWSGEALASGDHCSKEGIPWVVKEVRVW